MKIKDLAADNENMRMNISEKGIRKGKIR